ncbi:hypothetical protein AEQU3_02373 [Aequorivita antarctica]|nr:hypothetical protein AEQU3_02373 [Aequorivita antarctica]
MDKYKVTYLIMKHIFDVVGTTVHGIASLRSQ